jgi:hypothetical protein
MAVREPKIRSHIAIDVIGRPGGRKGRFELTTGNLLYFRQGAKTETLRLTYQQLLTALEREVEYQVLDPGKVKLPKPHKTGDFSLEVSERDEIEIGEFVPRVYAASSLKQFHPSSVDHGTYQFSNHRKRFRWFAHVSIQAALWILNCYIDKFLRYKKMSTHTDRDVVVSKQKMREVILMMLKKVDS